MKPDYALKPGMELLGIEKLRDPQIKPIQSLMYGNDTVIIAGTASGKSITFQLAGLVHDNELTLVIEPTLSLIYDQVQSLQEHGVNADYIDHFRKKKDVESILHKAKNGKLTFLYVTPERLQSHQFQDAMANTHIYMVVVDECHCVTEWGNTFRDAYLKIGEFIDMLPKRPVVCACTATLPEGKFPEITELLHLDHPIIRRSDLRRKNLVLLKKDVTSKEKKLGNRLEERFELIAKYIRKYHHNGSVVIYALTTGYVDAIYNYLSELYPGQVARYHAQMQSEHLQHRMEIDFLQGKRKIMVATTAFGMGINVPDIELVLHFNTPISMIDYIQQIGRGGRDEKVRAYCVLFYEHNGDDRQIVRSFIKKAAKRSEEAVEILEGTIELALQMIEESSFRQKTKKKMSRVVKLAAKCESLVEVRKKMTVSHKHFKALLDRFRKLGISPITKDE